MGWIGWTDRGRTGLGTHVTRWLLLCLPMVTALTGCNASQPVSDVAFPATPDPCHSAFPEVYGVAYRVTAWVDQDEDGLREESEPPLAGAKVTLSNLRINECGWFLISSCTPTSDFDQLPDGNSSVRDLEKAAQCTLREGLDAATNENGVLLIYVEMDRGGDFSFSAIAPQGYRHTTAPTLDSAAELQFGFRPKRSIMSRAP